MLAFPSGSVPEIIDQGVTGLIVDSLEEAVAAMPRLLALDRNVVRRRFEDRFSATRMAQDYVSVYGNLLRSLHNSVNGVLAFDPTSRPSRGNARSLEHQNGSRT